MNLLCLLLQRYTFWSNSQPNSIHEKIGDNCACYCKDTHFEAIHNYQLSSCFIDTLCLLLQRYTFWSNSQLVQWWGVNTQYCACYCKDTHFEAIHNTKKKNLENLLIVLATAKIHILKQFTTTTRRYSAFSKLCLLLQRYTFWSNSQQSNIKRWTR